MVALSIMIEGQNGLTWPRWKQVVKEVEDLGFAGLFRSDHFKHAQPPDDESLELIVSLTYLADHTRRIHFGSLVVPVSLRDPALLTRQAIALDDLSGGRLILGVGAGWQEREHHLFGYTLGDVPTRMARLEEGLEVITRLLRSEEPVTYEGRFFQLRGAALLPHPGRSGGPPILIGGNSTNTLRLVARYADLATLDQLLRTAGRNPGDVRRSVMLGLFFARDRSELERQLRETPGFTGQSLESFIEALKASEIAIAGTPDMILEQIHAYEQAGAEELMLQWLDLDDMEGLRAFAASVLPHV
ncbi:MAG: LLM class F420-dependent oxidoreductase [Ktedonobacter sp. 13_2_20CM_53_11]|nr:MAG: LLM class F420-dependent oxidoreductase [Ktedonobacter sp. 13_2_20CM_53_11]